jgi:hypothetical protein
MVGSPVLSAGARRLLVVCLLLLVAACGGKGCGGGCASCGTTPLPGGFAKIHTIPNAASVRITRPGLSFVQENIGTLAEKALGAGATAGVTSFPIPKSSQSFATICSPATPTAAQCNAEIDLGKAKLRANAITPNRIKLDGLLPVRIKDLPISINILIPIPASVVAGDKTLAPGQDLCTASLRGSPTMPYKEFPVNVELPFVTETRIPRNGYTKVDVDKAIIDIGITQNDIEICSNSFVPQGIFDAIKSFAFNILIDGVKGQIKTALSSAFCTAPTPTVTPACPVGSSPDNADLTKATKCVFAGTQECVPSLLGLDGRMDLSKALSTFSPGTQGGLDFVLASAGDMNPAPAVATLPAWTPRKPPVAAEDNNANGISLSMIGGAQPQPQTKCVNVATNSPPQNIPLPKELLGDVVTPWPAGTPGPHLGFAIAGRYLDHAFVSAYNSGLLCLGISTDQVDQLQSGYLSILAPSIKFLTFEQAAAAAAITTRPGVPPKIKVGGGTNIKTDPLLTITLDKFAIDFYLYRMDRYVRIFTFTADLIVPVNLQTGKDPKTNPTGGILPVLGDIKLANAAVTNADSMFEEPKQLADGVSGLLGGIVGSFLGGGFKAIDISSALKSFGLGLEIPPGGIRKLTSGTDDFVALFANLSKVEGAAHEEADTRAVLVEKIVDASAMSLGTADRARFPKLRVKAEGIASRPTEHTWWIDDGTHAAWTTAQELVVDQDAMLMQGKHVLHVSSRVVGNMASEDSTPAELAFTIDTLAPFVDVQREGSRVVVRAQDYVSAASALVARRRVTLDGAASEAAWSEWAPLAGTETFEADASAAVDVEVRDEEGNIGRVALPLRGRADGTLAAAGSGCGCRVVGNGAHDRSNDTTIAFGLALALAGVLARRRRASVA